eukprot:m.178744 g.178744  ORF g.178744 m.178744 type:complete len:97 (+) comp17398_c1_seq4:61-351(+)
MSDSSEENFDDQPEDDDEEEEDDEDEWDIACGGCTVYEAAADPEDPESGPEVLLQLPPIANSVNVVFRDASTRRSVGYLNATTQVTLMDAAFVYAE